MRGSLKRLRPLCRRDSERLFLVPSAPGKRTYKDEKITDMLYTCADRAAKGMPFRDVFDRIAERYVDIAFELAIKFDLVPHLEEVYSRIAAGEGVDYAASRGEYLNGLLVSEYLGFAFVDPAEMVCFDQNGKFNPELTQAKMSARLTGMKRVIVPGFYGAMPDSRIKTFSRGGSDNFRRSGCPGGQCGCLRKLDGCFGFFDGRSAYRQGPQDHRRDLLQRASRAFLYGRDRAA